MGATATTAATHFVGIDVSKDTLDASLLGPSGSARGKPFANDPRGHAALLAWADRHAAGGTIHFCMEATGPYSAALAAFLHAAGRGVSVANPARVKAHMKSLGQGNKTDPADARAIASFARDRNPRPWAPPSPEVRQLQARARRRDDLRRMAAAEKTRLDAPDLTPAARKSITRVVKFLSKEADRVQAEAEAVVAATPDLAANLALLESVKGVGRQTATTVLAEVPRSPNSGRPSRRPPTPGWPGGSSPAASRSRSTPGCRRPGTPGSGRRSTCRP